MTNYGAIAILRALAEDAPARQLRVLIALETFRADPDGWRTAGQILLASTANMSIPTLKRARPELVQASLIEYRPGLGRGVLSRYRLMVNGLEKGSHADPFSDGKRVHPSPEKGSPKPGKGFTGKTGKSAVVAGHAAENGQGAVSPALSAKAEALKASGFSSGRGERARAGSARASAPEPARAPPCPECGKPFSQELLAKPGFLALAMEGSALCSEACDKADEAKYLRGHSYQQLIADGYSPEELARAGRRP